MDLEVLRTKIWVLNPLAVFFLTLSSDLNMASRHEMFLEI